MDRWGRWERVMLIALVYSDATLALAMRGMLVPCEWGGVLLYVERQTRWYREYNYPSLAYICQGLFCYQKRVSIKSLAWKVLNVISVGPNDWEKGAAIMNQLPLETLKKYAADYPIVPVYKEIFSDTRTVVSVLKALKTCKQNCLFIGKCG